MPRPANRQPVVTLTEFEEKLTVQYSPVLHVSNLLDALSPTHPAEVEIFKTEVRSIDFLMLSQPTDRKIWLEEVVAWVRIAAENTGYRVDDSRLEVGKQAVAHTLGMSTSL